MLLLKIMPGCFMAAVMLCIAQGAYGASIVPGAVPVVLAEISLHVQVCTKKFPEDVGSLSSSFESLKSDVSSIMPAEAWLESISGIERFPEFEAATVEKCKKIHEAFTSGSVKRSILKAVEIHEKSRAQESESGKHL